MHWYGIQKSYQYRTSKYVKRRLFAGRYQSAGPILKRVHRPRDRRAADNRIGMDPVRYR